LRRSRCEHPRSAVLRQAPPPPQRPRLARLRARRILRLWPPARSTMLQAFARRAPGSRYAARKQHLAPRLLGPLHRCTRDRRRPRKRAAWRRGGRRAQCQQQVADGSCVTAMRLAHEPGPFRIFGRRGARRRRRVFLPRCRSSAERAAHQARVRHTSRDIAERNHSRGCRSTA